MIPFVKTQALGNDFLLVEADRTDRAEHSALARSICDRRKGVGADGLILWNREGEGFGLRIFNKDGSEAECSGNGLRCAAAHLMGDRPETRGHIVLRTVSGTYTLRKVGNLFEADMGEPSLSPDSVPFRAPVGTDRIVDFPLEVEGKTVHITACATGNPHCTLFVDRIEPEQVGTLGPLLERHPAFPNRTNVEFVQVHDRDEIAVAFWERGVGRTPASGTGSCGATVAAILNGRTERRVHVRTDGGSLWVEWRKDGRLELRAEAHVVAEGHYLGKGGSETDG